MNIYKEVLEAEHPETLSSMDNLAWMYKNLNRSGEAEELEVQVSKAREKALGREHPDTLVSMGNLAITLKHQHHLEQALSLISDGVQLSETVLGADDPFFKQRLKWLKMNKYNDPPKTQVSYRFSMQALRLVSDYPSQENGPKKLEA